MAWVRLDDGFSEHAKILAAGPMAGWVYVCGLCYCNRQHTNGFIARAVLGRVASVPNRMRYVARLVHAGLWEEVEDGFWVHDYSDYQPTREHVEQLAEIRAVAGRKGGLASGAARANGQHRAGLSQSANGQHFASSKRSKPVKQNEPRPDPSRPDPDPETLSPLPPALSASVSVQPDAREPEPSRLRRVPKPAEIERAAIDAHPLTAPLVEQFGPVTSRDLDAWTADLAALDEMAARPEDIPRAAIGYAAIMGSDHTGRPIRMTRKALVQHWYSSLHAPLTPTRSPTDGRMPVHGELDPDKYLNGAYARFFNRAHDEDDAYDDIGEASP